MGRSAAHTSTAVQSESVSMPSTPNEDLQRLWIEQTEPVAGMQHKERRSLLLRAFRSLVTTQSLRRGVVRWREQRKACVHDSLVISLNYSQFMHGMIIEAVEGPKETFFYQKLITKQERIPPLLD